MIDREVSGCHPFGRQAPPDLSRAARRVREQMRNCRIQNAAALFDAARGCRFDRHCCNDSGQLGRVPLTTQPRRCQRWPMVADGHVFELLRRSPGGLERE
jgi:hypothetical protein